MIGNTVGIWILTIQILETFENWTFNIGFQIVQFSKGQALAMVPTIQKMDIFVWISNGFKLNGGHLSEFRPATRIRFRTPKQMEA